MTFELSCAKIGSVLIYMPEKIPFADRPTLLLHTALGKEEYLHSLLTDKANPLVRSSLSSEITHLTDQETESLLHQILDNFSQGEGWSQDKRDGAIALLGMINLNRIPARKLVEEYLQAVRRLDECSDPYGNISSLLEAGKMIAPRVVKNEVITQSLQEAWDKVGNRYSQDQQYIHSETASIIENLAVPALEGGKLGWREKPQFDPEIESLHDCYLEEVGERGSFKVALWEHTSEFRGICQERGVDLARFWNLENPDEVALKVEELKKSRNALLVNTVDKYLKQMTGQTLDSINEEQSRYLADEITQVALLSQEEIKNSANSFEFILSRVQQLLVKAQDKSRPQQRAILKPVVRFLETHGTSVSLFDIDSVTHLLTDPEELRKIEQSFQTKDSHKKQAIDSLNQLFPQRDNPDEVSLASRTRDDLFLGDQTGDCTAYHLNVGINAWSVPVWLSNPGFNFFKIQDGKKLVAKLGMVLALEGGVPRLVVDSIESGKSIQDEERAKQKIKEGLSSLKQWSESIGLGIPLFNTVANSSELGVLLEEDWTKPHTARELILLGGLEGVKELRKKLLGDEKEVSIYLQTTRQSDYEEQKSTEQKIADALREDFEGYINKALSSAQHQQEVDRIHQYAQTQDWNNLFPLLMGLLFPDVVSCMGDSWGYYKQKIDQVRDQQYSVIGEHDEILSEFWKKHYSEYEVELTVLENREKDRVDKLLEGEEQYSNLPKDYFDQETEKQLEEVAKEEVSDSDSLLEEAQADTEVPSNEYQRLTQIWRQGREAAAFMRLLKELKDNYLTPENMLEYLYAGAGQEIQLDSQNQPEGVYNLRRNIQILSL